MKSKINFPCVVGAAVLAVIALVGCSRQDGPPRYQVSGAATFGGQPIPLGEVEFSPDSKQGNTGPGTIAKIQDGRYETPSDRGVVGGPHNVRITGYDGKTNSESYSGVTIFSPHLETIDLPKEDTEYDFNVPRK
ncbi:hypothetical protein [Blastopirellula marina]|uniref:Lipoprotein n=1 Tax=Blastopirellula marina DSM 3645 TaxID=314230 RepID=A3ZQS4_9BACT|nr:hypothetical protein [Blastopirellula marina]EAQ81014.1 hypothetical protein DSM3645_20622 [Blastopirellula marina DSM 3645]